MSALRFNLLGVPGIELDGEPVRAERRKTAALLYYVAATGKPLARGPATGLLWPEFAPDRARTSLRRALVDANASIGLRVFEPERDVLRFSDGIAVEVDAAEFAALVSEGLASHNGQAVQSLERAAALYRGEFLSGFNLKDAIEFEDWQLGLADRFKAKAVEALQRLALAYKAEGRTADAQILADRIIQYAPLDEAGHRLMVEMLADRGEAGAARAHYEAYAAALDRELGARPEPSLARLYEDLKAGRRNPAPPPPKPRRGALPRPLSSFIGRADDLALLGSLLGERRLVTLVGPGGVGKTRLAVAASAIAEKGGRFPDGAAFVDLAPANPGEALATVAAALDAPLRPGEEARDFAERMVTLVALVVLDNCERVIDECGALVAALLAAAPGTSVLATSLEPLGLEGETTLLVKPLPVAPEDAPDDALLASEAVRLFLDRAALADPRGDHAASPALIAGMCRSLEGMPLAIELVAARARAFPLPEIAASLGDLFAAASDGPRGMIPRHRSLENLLAWSWERLEPEEADDLAALSVFRGGFDAAAAADVLGRPSIGPISRLVGKSLLTPDRVSECQERWRLLEPVRLFASARLAASGREEARRDAHASHFAARAARIGRRLLIIRDAAALDEADREWTNSAAALEWLIGSGRPEPALRAMIELRRFFRIRDRVSELMTHVERVDGTRLSATGAAAWHELSALGAWFALDMTGLEEHAMSASRYWTEAGDERAARRSELIWLGFHSGPSCGIDAVRSRLAESAEYFRELGERWLACEARISLAHQELALSDGRWPLFKESLASVSALAEASGDLEALSSRAWLGANAARYDEDASAVELALREVRRCDEAIGSTLFLSDMLDLAAEWALQKGDFGKAADTADEAAAIRERLGHPGLALELRVIQGEALNSAGRFGECAEAMARARALAGDDEESVALVDYRAALRMASRGQPEAALRSMRNASEAARPGGPAYAKLRLYTARMLLALEDYEAAGELLAETRAAFTDSKDTAYSVAAARYSAFLDAGADPRGAAAYLERKFSEEMDSANAFEAEWWAATAARAFAAAGAAAQAFRASAIAAEGAERRTGSFCWVERNLFASLLRRAAESVDPETKSRLKPEPADGIAATPVEAYVRAIADSLTRMLREVFGG